MRFNLSTEGLAEASARRPWLVIGVWAAVLILSLGLIGTLLGSALTTEIRLTNNPESARADSLLEKWQGVRHDDEVIIVQSQDLTVDAPAFEAKVQAVYQRITALGPDSVIGGTNYYQTNDSALVSSDRHVTIMPFQMAGTELHAADTIGGVLSIVEGSNRDGSFHVLAGGTASINHDVQQVAKSDLQTAEAIGIPIALLVLILVFGALTAALIPIILGIFSIIVALGITAIFGQEFQFSFFATNVITMMGLAVGIDYSLFIVSRYREERARGLEKHDAIRAAGDPRPAGRPRELPACADTRTISGSRRQRACRGDLGPHYSHSHALSRD
jgi:RND superfamily putative drug exporter